MPKNRSKPELEDKGLHISLYKRYVQKKPKLWNVIQKNLQELLEEFQRDPDRTILIYEKAISEDFLDRCDIPEKYWVFLILKFSLSYLNTTANVFNFHYESIKNFYDNDIPPPMKTNVEFARLLDNEQYRNLFLNRLYSTRRDLYLKLNKMLITYDRFKKVSGRDEKLEGKLNRKLAIFRYIHPIKFSRFIKYMEENQPSLRQYIPLIYV
ncbi:MAG: hypothetical protein ACUVQ8_00930 [Nitrososphaeria archaeon]